MRFDIITIFPEIFSILDDYGLIGKAIAANNLEVNIVNLRDYSDNKHNKVDDEIYGGGPGMLMTPGPIYNAVNALKSENSKVIYLSPQGQIMNQKLVIERSKEEHIILLCGHYEGIDQRVLDLVVDEEISIGDYVLTGGEIPAMIFIDAVSRFVPGVIGNENSMTEDSLYNGILKYPVYTRPRNFKGLEVPEILLSGNHKKIQEYRKEESLRVTKLKRPDLLDDIN